MLTVLPGLSDRRPTAVPGLPPRLLAAPRIRGRKSLSYGASAPSPAPLKASA